jgi:hypothetical protein
MRIAPWIFHFPLATNLLMLALWMKLDLLQFRQESFNRLSFFDKTAINLVPMFVISVAFLIIYHGVLVTTKHWINTDDTRVRRREL